MTKTAFGYGKENCIICKCCLEESGQMVFRSLFVYTRNKMTGKYRDVIINLSSLTALEFEEGV